MKKLLLLLLSLLTFLAIAKESSASESIYHIVEATGKEIRSNVTEVYDEDYKLNLKHKISDLRISFKVIDPKSLDYFGIVGFRYNEVDYTFETKAELIAAINSFSGIITGVSSTQGVRNFGLFCEPIFQKDCLIDRVYGSKYYDIETFYVPFSLLGKDGHEFEIRIDAEVPAYKVR